MFSDITPFLRSFMGQITVHCCSSGQLTHSPNKAEIRSESCLCPNPPVYQDPRHPVLFRHVTDCLQTPTLQLQFTHLSSQVLLPFQAFFSTALNVALLQFFGCCLCPACLNQSVCLSLQFPVPLSFSLFPYLLNLQIGCLFPVSESTQYFVLKIFFFSHLSPAAKSSHPSRTYCSSEFCQPSPVDFMNHFLFNFSLHFLHTRATFKILALLLLSGSF